ncbi:MAG: hypothetical protein NZM94_02315 [Roseiflexus sp.]|nr:hypothetical protein [Roseiflexus sp.]
MNRGLRPWRCAAGVAEVTMAGATRTARRAGVRVTVTSGWREAAGAVNRGLRPWRCAAGVAEVTATNTEKA